MARYSACVKVLGLMAIAALLATGAVAVKPRQTGITDFGYDNLPRGWYDAQCQGATNDYCRWVGNPGDSTGIWWSCALAGSSNQYTPPGQFTEDTTSFRPC